MFMLKGLLLLPVGDVEVVVVVVDDGNKFLTFIKVLKFVGYILGPRQLFLTSIYFYGNISESIIERSMPKNRRVHQNGILFQAEYHIV